MKNYNLFLATIFFFSIAKSKPSDNIFTLFFREDPTTENSTPKNKNIASGIVATSSGYMNISDKNGQISFPRGSQKNSIRIVVTKNVEPIFLNKGTLRHWNVTGPAQTYVYSRKQDKETKLYFWTAKKDTLPKDKKIPLHTMVILTSPEKIYIPEGITKTNKDTQLYLPDIYVKDGIESIEDALVSGRIRQYFSPILKLHATMPKGYLTLIKPLT